MESLNETISNYFFFFFPIFWFAVCFASSRLSGWSKLANNNPDQEPKNAKTFWFCSASFGKTIFGANYGNCLTISVGSDGIRLSVILPFRVGHNPIFLPWKKIDSISTHRFLFIQYFGINIGDQRLKIMGRAGDFINKKYEEARRAGVFDSAKGK